MFPGLDWQENVKAFPLSSINSNCSNKDGIISRQISRDRFGALEGLNQTQKVKEIMALHKCGMILGIFLCAAVAHGGNPQDCAALLLRDTFIPLFSNAEII